MLFSSIFVSAGSDMLPIVLRINVLARSGDAPELCGDKASAPNRPQSKRGPFLFDGERDCDSEHKVEGKVSEGCVSDREATSVLLGELVFMLACASSAIFENSCAMALRLMSCFFCSRSAAMSVRALRNILNSRLKSMRLCIRCLWSSTLAEASLCLCIVAALKASIPLLTAKWLIPQEVLLSVQVLAKCTFVSALMLVIRLSRSLSATPRSLSRSLRASWASSCISCTCSRRSSQCSTRFAG
mmetsp:Transcript_78550/g.199872  ORF Transcript_78550/g.199872 Transcript_78550/m.199872 type:complete len:243 (-) Transcript_78550:1018-1746(-)